VCIFYQQVVTEMEADKKQTHHQHANPEALARIEWKKEERKRKAQHLLTIASPIFLLLLWEVLSRTGLVDSRFFPPPTAIIGTFIKLLATGELLSHLEVSLLRITAGFLLGTIPAIILGLLMGLYTPVRNFFSPLIAALMPIPTLALMPLILIIFGIGETSKMFTIAGSVFFPVVINTVAGVVTIEPIYLDVAKNYGAGPWQFFFKIALPGALPVMMEGIQMGQAIALLTIVAAEMINAHTGVGYLIWTAYRIFNLKQMYIGLVIISFFGFLISIIIRWLQSKLIPWK
jgi:NitT/TauT family transport system permease protein